MGQSIDREKFGWSELPNVQSCLYSYPTPSDISREFRRIEEFREFNSNILATIVKYLTFPATPIQQLCVLESGQLYNLETGTVTDQILENKQLQQIVCSCVVSNKYIAISVNDGRLFLYNTETSSKEKPLLNNRYILALCVLPNNLFASVSRAPGANKDYHVDIFHVEANTALIHFTLDLELSASNSHHCLTPISNSQIIYGCSGYPGNVMKDLESPATHFFIFDLLSGKQLKSKKWTLTDKNVQPLQASPTGSIYALYNGILNYYDIQAKRCEAVSICPKNLTLFHQPELLSRDHHFTLSESMVICMHNAMGLEIASFSLFNTEQALLTQSLGRMLSFTMSGYGYLVTVHIGQPKLTPPKPGNLCVFDLDNRTLLKCFVLSQDFYPFMRTRLVTNRAPLIKDLK
jgi:hypothetical protein